MRSGGVRPNEGSDTCPPYPHSRTFPFRLSFVFNLLLADLPDRFW